jgi:cyanophycinase-like exopeptidase
MPKGRILLIGGREEKKIKNENILILKKERIHRHFKILKELIKNVPTRDHTIEIIAAASRIPEELEAMYVNAFKKLGFPYTHILALNNKVQMEDPDILKRINKAHAVFYRR